MQVGRIYEGTVTSVKDFGAFVEILPGKDGLCHISELADEYVSSVGDVCRVGDAMKVKVIAVDEQDRVKLSRKAAMREMAAAERRQRRAVSSLSRDRDIASRRSAESDPVCGLAAVIESHGRPAHRTAVDRRRFRRDGPAADGPVHGDRAAGRRAGARDQEPAVDDSAQHGTVGRGPGRAADAGRRRALKRVEVVRRECQRLQSLLDDFLNFAKVRRLHLEPSDLNHQIDDVLDFFAPEAEEAGVEIVRYLDPDLPRVMLDREAFRQALLEPDPQCQAGDAGRRSARRPHGRSKATRWRIYLIDTGCGMDDRTASQMFEAFFSTKPGGSGLGLPTTQKIIDAHGGRISVQSEVGHGTQFTIELPVPARIAGE